MCTGCYIALKKKKQRRPLRETKTSTQGNGYNAIHLFIKILCLLGFKHYFMVPSLSSDVFVYMLVGKLCVSVCVRARARARAAVSINASSINQTEVQDQNQLTFSPASASLSIFVAYPCSPLSLTLAFVLYLFRVQIYLLEISHVWIKIEKNPFSFHI